MWKQAISTTTQANGISYAWDRDYDIKTVSEAQKLYLTLRTQLESIPHRLAAMEALAAADGFSLTTENFGAFIERLAGEVLRANPGKALHLQPTDAPSGPIYAGFYVLLPKGRWLEAEEMPRPEEGLDVVVTEDGTPVTTAPLRAQSETYQVLVAGGYELRTLSELLAALAGPRPDPAAPATGRPAAS